MKSRALGQPASDERSLVGAVVIHDEMDRQGGGDSGIDRVEELSELKRTMPPVELAEDLAGLEIRGPQTARSCRGVCSRGSDARLGPGALATAVASDRAPESAPSRPRRARPHARADSCTGPPRHAPCRSAADRATA